MLKTSERKSTSPTPTCYDEAPNPAFGITFEKQDGTRRFVPYAFLSALDFDGSGELAFTFSSGVVTVRGNALGALWKAACKGDLARVWEGEQPPERKAAWVREIALGEAEPDPNPSLPAFPREPATF